jgi:hypothetical protein
MLTRDPLIICKVEKAINEMRDQKATRYDYVPGDILKLLGENGFRLIRQLINNIQESAQLLKDSSEVTITALQKKQKARKSSDNRTHSKCCSKDTYKNH